MARNRSTMRHQTFVHPDITPLVDLTFLLLIVFMITAPALEYSVDITPPELNAEPIEESINKVINLDKKGLIYLDQKPLSRAALMTSLSKFHEETPNIQVFIRADRNRIYGDVIDVMKLVKGIGITDVSLVTQSEER